MSCTCEACSRSMHRPRYRCWYRLVINDQQLAHLAAKAWVLEHAWSNSSFVLRASQLFARTFEEYTGFGATINSLEPWKQRVVCTRYLPSSSHVLASHWSSKTNQVLHEPCCTTEHILWRLSIIDSAIKVPHLGFAHVFHHQHPPRCQRCFRVCHC